MHYYHFSLLTKLSSHITEHHQGLVEGYQKKDRMIILEGLNIQFFLKEGMTM